MYNKLYFLVKVYIFDILLLQSKFLEKSFNVNNGKEIDCQQLGSIGRAIIVG